MAYQVDPSKCIACHTCVGACPVCAISVADDQKAVIDPAKCISCGTCAAVCPVGAIAPAMAAAKPAAPVVEMKPATDTDIKTAA
ncbi:4Fe-4S binding protein [bacterium]|nr:4Fe-4S binding protein [bacterium]